MYVCVYICMYVCMYVGMYECMNCHALLLLQRCRYELKGQQSDIYIVFIAEKVHEYNHNLLARLSAFLLERDRVLTESQQRDLLHRIKFVHVDFYYSLLPYARGVLDTYPYGGRMFFSFLRIMIM